jgi:hypothetical protein
MAYVKIEDKSGELCAFVELDYTPEVGEEMTDGGGVVWIVKEVTRNDR